MSAVCCRLMDRYIDDRVQGKQAYTYDLVRLVKRICGVGRCLHDWLHRSSASATVCYSSVCAGAIAGTIYICSLKLMHADKLYKSICPSVSSASDSRASLPVLHRPAAVLLLNKFRFERFPRDPTRVFIDIRGLRGRGLR
jgi:hypothetical protein